MISWQLKLGYVGTSLKQRNDFLSLAFNSTILNSPIIACTSSAIPFLNINNIQTFKDFGLIADLGLCPIAPMKSSFVNFEKPFKMLSSSIKSYYGGCSLTVECGTVDPETGVQLSPSAFVREL